MFPSLRLKFGKSYLLKLILLLAIFSIGQVVFAGFSIGGIDVKGVFDAVSKTKDLGDKSETEEQLIGEEVSTILLAKSKVLENDRVQRYVNRVGRWVAENTERPELPWHFIVLNDASFNAYAAPGGYVFITSGTLLHLDNEAELASILAHEMAHVLRKHYLESIKSKAKVGLAVDVGKLVYGSRSGNSGNSVFTSQFGSFAMTPEDQMISAVDNLYSKGLDRDDEYEADAMAMVITARAGYDPFAFLTVLQKIEGSRPDAKEWEVFLNSHPPASGRIDALEPVSEQPFAEQEGYQLLEDRYSHHLFDE